MRIPSKAISLLLLALASSSQAALLITFSEFSGNVNYLASGGIDLAGMTAVSGTPFSTSTSGIYPVAGGFSNQTATELPELLYTGISGPTSFGSGGQMLASSSSGSAVYFSPNENHLYVPSTYVSGNTLPMSGSYTGKTFATLGLTPGTYTWNLGTGAHADTLSIAVVPEPSAPLLGALGAAALLRRRRR
ncbi:MAG: hypothetical protein WCL19_07960 [Verrucomicrobiota bacterium]